MNLQAAVDKAVEQMKKTDAEKLTVCARCHKEKKTTKHHFPLGSHRKALLCEHCYTVLKKQRKRAIRF